MPQRVEIDGEEGSSLGSEFIPAVENAESYFAYVRFPDMKMRLCILDGNKWRIARYEELMDMIKG
ncbi:hypothetical protein 12VC501_gene0009 [Vibrio phage 12VC501]|nr:hypothetical protein 12VC501_gene0009 [Vibrio phage 12VC501]